MNYKLIGLLALMALVVLFVVQNTGVVQIRFLVWTLSMSRVLVILFVLVIGVVIGWLWHGRANRRH